VIDRWEDVPGDPLLEEYRARIAELERLLRDADAVVMWELTAARPGFQEEIEAALNPPQ
jgi:hypothetical protein